ncbi:MAG: endolytic transglycosylase MltG [Polaribacter sp.]
MSKKTIYGIAIAIFLLAGIVGVSYYQKIFGTNLVKNTSLFIYSSGNFSDLKEKIAPFLKNTANFIWVAHQKKFKNPRSGKYILTKGMSNNNLVNMLRSGRQTPVKISFNNQNTIEKFAKRMAEQLEPDSISLMKSFTDEAFLSKNNLTEKSVLQIFIPNTYEFYWNVSPKKFRKKMLIYYHQFWNENRLKKAENLNLTKQEVSTLASIVQKETAKTAEQPIIAGLYLNRLHKGWPLQADPTIIYCVKQLKGEDFVVKRVLNVDLEINSPYNTYLNVGLPPTLISMPDLSTIDAVLNAEKHNYYYMCASTSRIGYHEFSKTLAQHNRYAEKYQRWLNKQGVNR